MILIFDRNCFDLGVFVFTSLYLGQRVIRLRRQCLAKHLGSFNLGQNWCFARLPGRIERLLRTMRDHDSFLWRFKVFLESGIRVKDCARLKLATP